MDLLSGVLFAVGRAAILGGVWRAPPLALAEYNTQLSELLQPHSLHGLCTMFGCKFSGGNGGMLGLGPDVMAEAARMQRMKSLAMQISIK